MKKRHTKHLQKNRILIRILLPAVLLLLLLPPVSYTIFYYTISNFARAAASSELKKLSPDITAILLESEHLVDSNNSVNIQEYAIQQLSALQQSANGFAGTLIFDRNYELIYPKEQASVTPSMILGFASYLTKKANRSKQQMCLPVKLDDGSAYLIDIYPLPSDHGLIVSFCFTSRITKWVVQARTQLLCASFLLVSLVLFLLSIIARRITHPLEQLCHEAERFGHSEFEEITTPFKLYELEELRLALNQMAARLERSEQSQREFFQNVSHELRNPLMSISGYAQGISCGVFSPPDEAATHIMEESARLTGLVSSLLTLSRRQSSP